VVGVLQCGLVVAVCGTAILSCFVSPLFLWSPTSFPPCLSVHCWADMGLVTHSIDMLTFGSLFGVYTQAFRKLNAVTVPAIVTVPKSEEEDMKMKADREG